MSVLALDTGTVCGYALTDGERTSSGVRNLAGKEQPCRSRFANLWAMLEDFHEAWELTSVVYEQILRHRRKGQTGDNVKAAHVYGGWVAILELWTEFRGVQLLPIPVATVKACATGKGNARKDIVTEAGRLRWPGITDHNEIDARWILEAWGRRAKATKQG